MEKILLALDGSENSLKAINETIQLAKLLKARVTLLSVAEVTPIYHYSTEIGNIQIQQEMVEERLNASQEIMNNCQERFQENGIEVDTTLKEGQPAEVICQEAEKGGFDLIVIGCRGLGGIKEFFLGSVSNRVVNKSKVSVLVVK